MIDCEHCPHAQWDYDDAYGATILWVEGCKIEGKCPYEETDND